MTRPNATPLAQQKMDAFNADTLKRVQDAVATHDVVVVGMGWNPHVGKAHAALTEAGIAHHVLDIGNYASGWRERLAVKLWSGWPTYPQVFVKGTLVGGNTSLRASLADGTVAALLEG